MDKENVGCTYNGLLFSLKGGNPAICDNMEKTGGYYANWNKLDTEGQILQDAIYMRNLR